MRKELLEGLTEEQIAKVKECEDHSDLLQLAKDEGVELNEEQLEAVSGGSCYQSKIVWCSKCNKNYSCETLDYDQDSHLYTCKCPVCGHIFQVR